MKCQYSNSVYLFSILVFMCCMSIYSAMSTEEDQMANNYLNKFGYLEKMDEKTTSTSAQMINAITNFQKMAGIAETGCITRTTLDMMKLPRCGREDNMKDNMAKVEIKPWNTTVLKYRISKYSAMFKESKVDEVIYQALKHWSEATDLSFEQFNLETNQSVNIDIRFETYDHGDNLPFDGPGNEYGHAYFPYLNEQFSGDVHFDDSEDWTISEHRGINLLQVAVHEFGHSLGLLHSLDNNSIMAPIYHGYKFPFELHHIDISSIQDLYLDLCKTNITIDTIFTTANGDTLIFKGTFYWRLIHNDVDPAIRNKGKRFLYASKILSRFEGLESHIDAAFTWKDNKTYFLKGSNYWRSSDFQMDNQLPKSIHDLFQGLPNDIDAAFAAIEKQKVYFFKNEKIFLYNWNDENKPQFLRSDLGNNTFWKGLPTPIDSIFFKDMEHIYFIKGNQYWLFRHGDELEMVQDTDHQYPRYIGSSLFGCLDNSSVTYGAEEIDPRLRSPTANNRNPSTKSPSRTKPSTPIYTDADTKCLESGTTDLLHSETVLSISVIVYYYFSGIINIH